MSSPPEIRDFKTELETLKQRKGLKKFKKL